MPQNLSELRKITNFMRKNGILRYETPEMRVQLSQRALNVPEKKPATSGAGIQMDSMPDWNKLSLEEQLTWSSTPPGLEDKN